jgi:hypothetical protein
LFYNSIIDLEYDLIDSIKNPKRLSKKMHLEAKDNGVVILGNAICTKYRTFGWSMSPVVNRLDIDKLD